MKKDEVKVIKNKKKPNEIAIVEKVISTKAKEGKWKKPQTYQEQVSG